MLKDYNTRARRIFLAVPLLEPAGKLVEETGGRGGGGGGLGYTNIHNTNFPGARFAASLHPNRLT
jgi:hypothetical protein